MSEPVFGRSSREGPGRTSTQGPKGRDRGRGNRDDRNRTAGTPRARVAARFAVEAAAYPDIGVEPIDTTGLDERDGAFAHALYDAAIRRWLTIEWMCDGFGRRPTVELEPGVRAALVVGGAQILSMGSVPTHAAIDESVEWVKHAIRPGAGGLVNAVLRRVARALGPIEDGVWNGQRDLLPAGHGLVRPLVGLELPEPPDERIGAAFGLPLWLCRRLLKTYERDQVVEFGRASLAKPPAIVDVSSLGSMPGGCVPHDEPGYAVWDGERGGLEAVTEQPGVWVQDPSSGAAVRSIDGLTPATIVDLCAGMGTKTRQLRRAFPEARIIATDTDAKRLQTLEAVWAGDDNVRVMGFEEAVEASRGWADLVVLDVPCTNSGVLSRRVEARHRLNAAALRRLTRIQREILETGWACGSERGAILYATCSVDPEENSEQALWACDEFGLLPARERSDLPRGAGVSSRDGAYSVLLTGPGRLGYLPEQGA